jgi:hopene-associated glycosyltransferase HpnB
VSILSGAISLGIWIFLALFRGRFWELHARLRSARGDSAASVTAIIPARNEQGLIGRTVLSLLGQSHPVRVIVADDESEDEGAQEARAAGAEVVRAGVRPAGWKGKLWALSEGIRQSGGAPDYFLFTDADIEYASPGVVPALIAKAEEGFDLVSVMVRLQCESTAEKLLIPAFVFFFFMLYPPGTPAAAGGCVLIRRKMLERMGGVASIRSALIDDCALAARAAAVGGRVWLGLSDLPILSARGYGGAAGIRAMIARSAFAQLRHSALLLAGTVLGLLVTYVAPVVVLFSGNRWAAGMGGTAWLLSAALFLPTVREYGAPLLTCLCLPGIAVFYLIATVESALNYWRGRGGVWKGRVQDE